MMNIQGFHQEIDRTFSEFFAKEKPPGMIYGICENGTLVHQKCFGVSDPSSQTPIRPENVFRIASMTKSFAALAILQLRDEAVLGLHDAVSRFVPELRKHPRWEKTSIFHLLSMQSGLATDDPWADRKLAANDEQFSKIFLEPMQFSGEVGEEYHYSNLGYMLLGRIISRASGQHALKFIRERIIQPLGLRSTDWNESDFSSMAVPGFSKSAIGYRVEPRSCVTGDGAVFAGLWSSLPDLCRWIAFLCEAYDESDEQFQSIADAASRRELQQAVCLMPVRTAGSYSAYCLGLRRHSLPLAWAVGHSGGLPGYSSHMRWSRELKVGIIAFTNLSYAPVWDACESSLAILAAAIPTPDPRLRAGVMLRAEELWSLLLSWNETLAAAVFASNFFLDNEKDEFRRKYVSLRPLDSSTSKFSLVSERGLGGQVLINGIPRFSFTLAPTEGGKVQGITFLSNEK